MPVNPYSGSSAFAGPWFDSHGGSLDLQAHVLLISGDTILISRCLLLPGVNSVKNVPKVSGEEA